jgi:anti-sigma factor RsiW
MKKHCKWSEELSSYLDGELGASSRLKFEAHLGSCFNCTEMLAQLRNLRHCFQSLPQQEVGFDLAPVILAYPAHRARPAWRPSFSWWQMLPVSFAAAATVSLGVFMGTSLSSKPDIGLVVPTLAVFEPMPPFDVCVAVMSGCYPKDNI